MEKEQLVQAVTLLQQGDEAAATQIYEAFQPQLYYFILKNVNDQELAEDLTQESFIEILDTIHKLQEPAAFPGWARQIAYHKCTAYFRKRHELLADEYEDGSTFFDTVAEDRAEFIPDEALDKEDLKATILEMVNSLPEEQRAAILLRYYNEVSIKEIAKIQGVPENTVKSRLNYGRKVLKQAVENYEKKNGVKLRCVGIVPLLLWLFRQLPASQAAALGAKATTSAAAMGATLSTASATAAPVSSAASSAVAASAKKAGFFTVKKLIAGIVAASVVVGGVITAALLNNDEPEPKSMTWSGYSNESFKYWNDYFQLTVDYMDDQKLEGTLTVQHHHKTFFETTVSGEGQENKKGQIVYTLNYETPYTSSSVVSITYTDITAIYDKTADTIRLDGHFDVCMVREGSIKQKTLARNATWSGVGEDIFYTGFGYKEHDFRLEIQEMTTTTITGRLVVSYKGSVDHDTTFTGRGYERNGIIYYDVLLDTPRVVKYSYITLDMSALWLEYHIDDDVISISELDSFYNVSMQRDS